MRALVTRLRPDKRREKVLVNDWPAPQGPTGNQVKSRTIYSGITNGTEHNDLVGGNYAHPDDALPAGWGYQHVGARDRDRALMLRSLPSATCCISMPTTRNTW